MSANIIPSDEELHERYGALMENEAIRRVSDWNFPDVHVEVDEVDYVKVLERAQSNLAVFARGIAEALGKPPFV